jgi:hypothetical protein
VSSEVSACGFAIAVLFAGHSELAASSHSTSARARRRDSTLGKRAATITHQIIKGAQPTARLCAGRPASSTATPQDHEVRLEY